MNWDDLFDWKEKHPGEPLYPCARFDGMVHLTRYVNRYRVQTYCGLAGPAKPHVLAFKLPRQSVDCKKCLTLAKVLTPASASVP